MKIIITGGSGFIGTHLADFLLQEGHRAELSGTPAFATKTTNLFQPTLPKQVTGRMN